MISCFPKYVTCGDVKMKLENPLMKKFLQFAIVCHQNNRKIQSTCRSETDKSKHNSIQLYNMASSMAPKPPLTHRKQQFITNLYICTFVTQLYIKFLDNTFSAMPTAAYTRQNIHIYILLNTYIEAIDNAYWYGRAIRCNAGCGDQERRLYASWRHWDKVTRKGDEHIKRSPICGGSHDQPNITNIQMSGGWSSR